ncbi:carbohydrate ABC transporter permease [Butyrivibrio sp.]|uniref:carbohydrate ABC transporter permease n=1 Tax=Butyrivibrio sp. TaxID=28121 RepID=UPI0025B88B47|nr:sugar ABC transporter permease [Butyrivibrio sp.]
MDAASLYEIGEKRKMAKNSEKVKRKNTRSAYNKSEERCAYLCLIPAFMGITFISYLPTIAVFALSLFNYNGLSTPEFVGIDNYARIFTKDVYFVSAVKATLQYAFYAVISAVVYSLIIALLLNSKIFGRTIFRSIFFIPYLLPAIGVFKGWQ